MPCMSGVYQILQEFLWADERRKIAFLLLNLRATKVCGSLRSSPAATQSVSEVSIMQSDDSTFFVNTFKKAATCLTF